jgi:uncharacterized protein
MPVFRNPEVRGLYAAITADHKLRPQSPTNRLGELVMHVSEGCNLACTYCFADRGQYGATSTKWMTADQAGSYARSTAERYDAVESVKFFGGEPLINVPAIKAAAAAFKELAAEGRLEAEPEYGAISNMTITNKTVINVINDLKMVVTGSIDGPPEINDKFRIYDNGRGSWKNIDRGIKKLRAETGQPSCLEVVYGPAHIDLGYSMIDIHDYLAREYGVNVIIIHPMSSQEGVRDEFDWNEYYDNLQAINYEYAQWLVKNYADDAHRYVVKFKLTGLTTATRADTHCSLGIGTQTVTADGVLYPCYTLIGHDEFAMDQDVTSLTKTDDYGRVQLRLIENRKSTNPVCSRCDIMKTCTACPGSNLTVNGAIDLPDPGHCKSSIGDTEGFLSALMELRQDPATWASFVEVMNNTSLTNFLGQDKGMESTLLAS